ncbi:hypothetical protein PCH_Pc13g06800 [Penicillium rubens Wisconsin 54-1255]|uniref:Uncharacterized protein n=1 Tax=Penicillium rubens (strain ATCC 28089 / DSM 1075 / NRRL 1951 / Wisconsin 54-1255) TaxID=500485 RepID=B6H3J9_PENRW|nr:hypothetical protein PCH_Pc13g06800 [Penicillium rubens Wisconsin 54-1255]
MAGNDDQRALSFRLVRRATYNIGGHVQLRQGLQGQETSRPLFAPGNVKAYRSNIFPKHFWLHDIIRNFNLVSKTPKCGDIRHKYLNTWIMHRFLEGRCTSLGICMLHTEYGGANSANSPSILPSLFPSKVRRTP